MVVVLIKRNNQSKMMNTIPRFLETASKRELAIKIQVASPINLVVFLEVSLPCLS